jgi:hypothetical protein
MTSSLKNHPIWQDMNQALKQLDPHEIANQHLHDCNTQIQGYWDEDRFYELISFRQLPQPRLISSSWGITPNGATAKHWLQLNYVLEIKPSSRDSAFIPESGQVVGDLVLILDEGLEVIDENWLIDLQSPYVVAVKEE